MSKQFNRARPTTFIYAQVKKNFTCSKLEVFGFLLLVFCTVELRSLWLVAWPTTLPVRN